MKMTTVKAIVAKVMTVGLLAGAVAVAIPANAQEFRGEFGTPVVYGHARFDYSHRDGFEFQRREAFRREEFRRDEFRRHEERMRFDRFHGDPHARFER